MKNQTKNYKIKIVGVGDYGIRFIETLGEMPNVEGVNINTDWIFMGKSNNQKLKIGKQTTKGLGAGALAEVGMKSAEEDKNEIVDSLKDSSIVFIVAGLGGGTGSGAAPVIANVAKKLHIPTIVFVTTPTRFESKIRFNNSGYGIQQLQNIADALVIIETDKMFENFIKNYCDKNVELTKFFAKVDEILQKIIKNVVEYLNI